MFTTPPQQWLCQTTQNQVDGGRSRDLKEDRQKRWKGISSSLRSARSQVLLLILLILSAQALKKPRQLFPGCLLTFPNHGGNFRKPQPGREAQGQQFSFLIRERVQVCLHPGQRFSGDDHLLGTVMRDGDLTKRFPGNG